MNEFSDCFCSDSSLVESDNTFLEQMHLGHYCHQIASAPQTARARVGSYVRFEVYAGAVTFVCFPDGINAMLESPSAFAGCRC